MVSEPREEQSPATGLAERSRVQGEAPAALAWLRIRNTYLVTQYVFLGEVLLGSVPPGGAGTFEIPPGAHNITLSDSGVAHANAQILAEVFDAGCSYHYDVIVR